MKKILYILLFIFALNFIPVDTVSADSVMEPNWSEFCPPLYENAVFKKARKNTKRYMENNYWALRKVKFEKEITECKAYSKNASELNTCYKRVANLEKNKTNQRNAQKAEWAENQDRQIMDGVQSTKGTTTHNYNYSVLKK